MSAEPLPKLRPLRLVELLDQAIRLYRRNFFKFVGIISVVLIPTTVLNLLFSLLSMSGLLTQMHGPERLRTVNPFALFGPGYFIGLAGNCLLAIVTMILLQGVALAALTYAATGSYFGRPIGLVDAYHKILGHLPRLIGAMAVALLITATLAIWSFLPCIGWFTGMGAWIFFMMVILYLIAPVIVLEKQPALRAIRRAWDLTRQRFWWVVGFLLILYLFNLLITAGPLLLLQTAFQAIFGNPFLSDTPTAAYAIQTLTPSLVSLAGSLIYTPLHMTCMTLMYLDLRVRTEGLDLALQAADASTDVDDILAQAPEPEAGGLITWREIGYFALLSLGFIVAFVVLYAIIMVLIFSVVGIGVGL
jgi:hypothetical protein